MPAARGSVGAPSTWALDPSRSYDGAMSRGGARTAAAMGTFQDARRMARRRVPRAVFDYVDGGADAELPSQVNRNSLEPVGFLPTFGVAPRYPEHTSTLLGPQLWMPLTPSPGGTQPTYYVAGDDAQAPPRR